jgi:hypothetical protein
MAPPPPGAIGIKPEPAAAAGAAEQQQQQQQQQPGSAAVGAPAAAAAAPGQQQLPPPPPQQQQQQPQQQQQQADSPQESGGASADEVVASTAGGAGTRAVTMHTLGDACTVAQSGTNVRPSHFVKSKQRVSYLRKTLSVRERAVLLVLTPTCCFWSLGAEFKSVAYLGCVEWLCSSW